ncbi:hypothetical protein K502DRAFT_330371 [Neoconidiobolus thromboides FSU 785]|nr:hypothetical protein K502DRAFT_330371 [Neoconidiobolus thromboides FSU 785]
MFDIKTHLELPTYLWVYPNNTKLYSFLDEYFKNILGLWHTNCINGMTDEEYMDKNEIRIKELFQSLEHLGLDDLNYYFATSILPNLSSNLNLLIINDIFDIEVTCFEDSLNK